MMPPAATRPPYALPSESPTGGIDVYAHRVVRRIVYADLFAEVAALQAKLSAAGVTRRAIVGLIGDNCLEWVLLDLALTAMGCVTVAFPETTFGRGDRDALADEYELSVLFVAWRFAGERRPWIAVMGETDSIARLVPRTRKSGPITCLARDSDLCAVIFSSGSSGGLKPITLTCAGVESVLDAFVLSYALGPGDGVFVGLPMSIFQQRVLIYSALRSGADIRFTDPSSLFHGLAVLSPSVVLAPPSLFETIEERGAGPGGAEKAFGGRPRLLLTGSAPSRVSTLAFYDTAELPLFQIYGMAEVGFIAWNRPGANRPGSVGKPVFPGSIEIADDGEILVASPKRQAIGYLGAAARNAGDIFLPDGRVATGDLGAFDPDGYLMITGRKKNLILTRSGRKWSVEAIEAALGAIAGVRHAVVLGGGDLPWPIAILSVDPTRRAVVDAAAARAIAAHNDAVDPDMHVARVIVSDIQFTPDNGLLTRNLKLDRAAIRAHFDAALTGEPT